MKEPKHQSKKIPYPNAEILLQTRHAVALLKAWIAVPDDKGNIWWDEFERDLQENRLEFRVIEG